MPLELKSTGERNWQVCIKDTSIALGRFNGVSRAYVEYQMKKWRIRTFNVPGHTWTVDLKDGTTWDGVTGKVLCGGVAAVVRAECD